MTHLLAPGQGAICLTANLTASSAYILGNGQYTALPEVKLSLENTEYNTNVLPSQI